jgi:hypothetical protein
MPPTIQLSISEAHNQLRTGHQDIRTYFSGTAAPERNMSATLATVTATATTSPKRLSTATTIDKKPARYDFNQHSQI